MGRSISSLIWEYILPVMTEHYFEHLIDERGNWHFYKNCEGGERQQSIHIITRDFREKSIELLLRIKPTHKYRHMQLEQIMVEDQKFVKSSMGGWVFKNSKDAKAIIQMIAESKENIFKVLDEALNDPEDIYPTAAEYRELYDNHQKYAEEFRRKYALYNWDMESTLDAIKKEFEQFPLKITLENRKGLLSVAAACGEIFIAKGGNWIWDEKNHMTRIEIMNQKWGSLQGVNSYLNLVFEAVLSDNFNLISDIVINDLKSTGNF